METIGTYQLQAVLGRGSTGVVHQGLDPARGRQVAIKHLAVSAPAARATCARFLRDAQAAGSLGHPNLATVWEVGEDQGQLFVAMELLDGVDLQQVIRSQKPFPLERILDMLRQICEGLAHAHRNGLLHLDLKPTDIRVTPGGEIKILDFGLAHLKSLERLGQGPAPPGVHYRAPEQVEGKKADQRTDVFSFGAIAYELLAHRRAFPGDDVAAVFLNIRRKGPDPKGLPESLFSPGLEAIILRALAIDPRRRQSSFEELHAELVRLVGEVAPRLRELGQPPPAPPPGPVREEEDLRTELARSRAEDRLPRALEICERLLELDPEDEGARRAAGEIEASLRDREVERLCGLALSHAADGEVALATEIAEKVERLAPWSPRYLQLQIYLDEEAARRQAESLVQAARDHIAQGRIPEARAAAEEALNRHPGQAAALEILQHTAPQSAPPAPSAPETPQAPSEPARRARIESLTSAALSHFVGNDHRGARRAVEEALALDPENRKALELKKILGTLR